MKSIDKLDYFMAFNKYVKIKSNKKKTEQNKFLLKIKWKTI